MKTKASTRGKPRKTKIKKVVMTYRNNLGMGPKINNLGIALQLKQLSKPWPLGPRGAPK